MKLLGVIFAVLVLRGVWAADKETSEAGIFVKVQGQSGKITVADGELKMGDPNRVTIEFSELKELDKDGNVVGSSGTPKHSFNSFASKEFTFSAINPNAQFQNISVATFSFTASGLGDGGKFTANIYIFKADGEYQLSGETHSPKKGQMKFDLQFESWKFCGAGATCTKGSTNEVGTQLELTVIIKGKGTPSKKSGKAGEVDSYDLGGDAKVILSKKVDVDGTYQDMASSFPKMTTQGGKQLFAFRFPKFSTKVYYDPEVSLTASSATSVYVSFLSLLMAIMAVIFNY